MIIKTWNELARHAGPDATVWELFHENSKLSDYSSRLPEAAVAECSSRMAESLVFENSAETRLARPILSESLFRDGIHNRISAGMQQTTSLTLEKLTALLTFGFGNYNQETPSAGNRLRPAFSTSSRCPLELFVHASRTEGLEIGLYHYNPSLQAVYLIRRGDQSQRLGPCFRDRGLVQSAAALLFIAAVPERATFHHGDRGYRFALMEAGSVVQNFHLIASALELSSVNVGEYFDQDLDAMFSFDGLSISIIYVVACGETARKEDPSVHSKKASMEVV